MELTDALRAMRARWWLLLLAMAIGAVAGAGLAHLGTPVYTSTTQLFVATAPTTDNAAQNAGALFIGQRLSSYLELLDSEQLAGEVAADLKLRATPDDVRSRVTASVLPNTVLVQIAAQDRTPSAARALADAYARRFVRDATALETADHQKKATVRIVVTDWARQMPVIRTSPNPGRDVSLGVLLGLLVAASTIGGAARLDTKVRSPRDVARATGSDRVSYLFRFAGASGDEGTTASRAVRSLVVNVQAARAQVIAVCGPAGGEERSAVSVALAMGLSRAGCRVLLVDADGRADGAGRVLGMPDAPGLADVVAGRVSPRAAVRRTDRPNLAVLPAGAEPLGAVDASAVDVVFAALRRSYDVVVIDASPVLSDTHTLDMARSIDGSLLVARPGLTRRDDLAEAAHRLTSVDVPVLGSVMTGVSERVAVHRGWVVPYAPDAGRMPVTETVPQHGAAQPATAYADLAVHRTVEPSASNGRGTLAVTSTPFERLTNLVTAARQAGYVDLLLAQLVPLGISFILALLSAMYLGPERRGVLTFLMTSSLLFGALAYGSLHVPVVSGLRAGGRTDLRHGVRVVGALWGALSLAGLALVVGERVGQGHWALSPISQVGCGFIGAGAVVAQLFTQRVLQGLSRNREYQSVVVLQTVVYLLTTAVILLLTRSPLLMFVGWYCSVLLGVLQGVSLLRRHLVSYDNPTGRESSLRAFVRTAMANNVGSIGQMVMLRADVLVVTLVVGPAAAGVYGIALSLTELALIAPEVFSLSVFANRARMDPDQWTEHLHRTTRLSSRVTLLTAVAIAVLTLVLSWTVLSAYTGLVLLVLLILPGALFAGYSRVALSALQALDVPSTVWRFGVLALALAATYIPAAFIGGANGPAVMSTVSYAATAVYLRHGLRARLVELVPA